MAGSISNCEPWTNYSTRDQWPPHWGFPVVPVVAAAPPFQYKPGLRLVGVHSPVKAGAGPLSRGCLLSFLRWTRGCLPLPPVPSQDCEHLHPLSWAQVSGRRALARWPRGSQCWCVVLSSQTVVKTKFAGKVHRIPRRKDLHLSRVTIKYKSH